jgi:uncharacterized OB-fold protein
VVFEEEYVIVPPREYDPRCICEMAVEVESRMSKGRIQSMALICVSPDWW